MALTQDQIDGLIAAHNAATAADDPSIYYTELAKYYSYGTLALGVEQNTTLSGILANNFAENKLVHDFGGTFTDGDRHRLMMNLMNEDFNVRNTSGWADINGQNISNYHDTAFTDSFPTQPQAPEAWVIYDPVRALNDYESWLPSSSATSLLVSDTLSERMSARLLFGSSTSQPLAYQWFQDLSAHVFNRSTWHFDPGDDVLRKSFAEFATQNNLSWRQFVENSTPDARSATDLSGFYGMSYQQLALSLVQQSIDTASNAFASVVSLANGTYSVAVGAAEALGIDTAEWLDDAMTGAKLSVLGGLNEQNWAALQTPPQNYAATLGQLDGYTPAAVIFATDISATAGSADTLMLASSAHTDLTGGGGNDVLIGNSGADELTGGLGDDLLLGGTGADVLVSDAGSDILDGGAGNDQIITSALSDPSDIPTIVMREGSGHDTLLIDNEITTIQFEDVNSSEVSLIWDYDDHYAGEGLYDRYGWAALKIDATGDSIYTFISCNYTIEGDNSAYSFGTPLQFEDKFVANWKELFGDVRDIPDEVVPDEYQFGLSDHDAERAQPVPIDGSDNDDVLPGTSGPDAITAGAGNDAVYGGAGDDTFVETAGSGNDLYDGGDGSDTLLYTVTTAVDVDLGAGSASGSEIGSDTLASIENVKSGGSNDTLTGDAGNNVLQGGAGSDSLDGAGGFDTADYSDSGEAVSVSLSIGVGSGGDAQGDTLIAIENLTGSAGNDTLAGDSGSNVLDGLEGDDILAGGAGDDSVQGGIGSDTYQYTDGAGVDVLLDIGFSTDTDVLSLGAGLNPADAVLLLSTADPNDVTVTFAGHPGSILLDDQLRDTSYGDASYGDASYGIEQIRFDGGTIWGRTDIATKAHFNQAPTAAVDVGNAVEASPIVMAAADLAANDSDADGDGLSIEGVSNAVGGVAVLTLAGDVVFAPTNGFTGTAGYDYTVSDGVGGTDTAHVTLTITADPTPIGTTVNGTSGDDTLGATADRDTMHGGAGDDGLFGGAGNDVLYGEDGNDSLDGEDGDNLLIGGAGDDWMIAEGGNDRFDGGDGFDAVDFSGFSTGGFYDLLGGSYQIGTVVGTMTSVEWLNLAGGDDVVRGDANYNSVYAGAGNDQVFAGDGDDDINGGDGNDTLYGEGGADILQGGIGDDTIDGGAGDDPWLFGGDGLDTIHGGDGNDEISGDNDADQLYGDAGADSIVGDAGNDIINGGSGDDTWLAGGDGDDVIRGGAGNDEMSGDGGADELYGDAGADDLNGGAGNDSLYGGSDNDTLNGDADDDLLDGGAGDDFLNGGAGADQLFGGTGIDELTGGDGDDTLSGGDGDDDWIDGSAGNDTLAGNAGNDVLNGGAGDDTYQFGRGDGFDIVFNSDTTSTSDEVLFGAGIATDQLWFMQQGDDLSVSIVGTQDSVTIKDWYTDTDVTMNFATGDDGSTLAKASVQQLVDAMAQFDAPSGTDTGLPPSYQQALEPTIAAAWQTT